MKNKLLLLFIALLCFGCSKEEKNIELFYGFWKVEESNWTIVDGIGSTPIFQEYFIELNEENCGKKYNALKIETNDVKWAFQQDSIEKYLLLSIVENLAPNSYNLGEDNIYFVGLLIEDQIRLSRQVVSEDKSQISNRNLFLTRE